MVIKLPWVLEKLGDSWPADLLPNSYENWSMELFNMSFSHVTKKRNNIVDIILSNSNFLRILRSTLMAAPKVINSLNMQGRAFPNKRVDIL
jgi:hypothetical protein